MRKIWAVLVMVLLGFSLVGCAAGYETVGNNDGSDESSGEMTLYASNRKIIYEVSLGISSKRLLPVYDEILSMINPDEWVESQQIGTRSGQIVLRIKTSRLLAFTDAIRAQFDVTHFNHSSRDVSLSYYNNETRIDALEAEQARLIELFDQASISEQIMINQRLSTIESELRSLNETNNETDSLIEYSQVTIQLNSSAPYDTLNFGQKIKRAFFGGIDAFITVLEYLVLSILSLLPFIIVGVPAVMGILYINKKKYQKRLEKRNQIQTRR